MKTGNKIVSLLLACSMLAASFAGTTAFAASDKPTPVEGEIETGAVMGYSHSGMDTSYMLDAAAKPRMLSRAARSAQEELPAAYNTIDAGRVTTQVRDQAGWGTCWAFAATGSIASSLYDELQENTPVLSPAHLAYFAFHGKANPEDPADKTDGDTYLPYEYDESMINDDYREYVGGGNTFCSTATFIDSAKSEAIDNILAMGALKQEGRIGRLLVTGCLSQRYQDEILQEMPEVDGVLGTGSYDDIVSVADRLLNGGETVSEFGDIDAPADEAGRVLTTPQHYAYIKIAEGCNNFCAFCIIPHLRGRYRSRAVEDILQEARGLAESGVKELIVVAQDTSRYGTDLYGAPRLPLLLHELCRIEGFHWIRVHYLYPDMITDELLDTFASEPKLVNYMDIPIQHVNDAILRRMNRRGTRAELDEMLQKLRRRLPDAVIRTSLITGLPGEGEAEFEELCTWLRENKLERVGAFVFSPEDGTPAAKMEHADEEVAQRRAEIIAELQSRIMDEYNAARVGTVMEVLCEGEEPETGRCFGRTYADSPDIDGRVLFSAARSVVPGEFVMVRITGAEDGDLVGEMEENA